MNHVQVVSFLGIQILSKCNLQSESKNRKEKKNKEFIFLNLFLVVKIKQKNRFVN